MKRLALTALKAWKEKASRKPLILRGARQVGKTWLMKTFGETAYEQCIYINFETNKQVASLFDDDFDLQRIILALEIESNITINPNNTLIIFDEIQAVDRALTSLKYFQELAPEYHIMAAGSLLGIALHKNTSFPVGKVEFLDLYPLNFIEFMHAMDENRLVDLLISQNWSLITTFKAKYIQLLKHYYYIGGMPEAVLEFSVNQNFKEVREIHQRILTAYEQDFSKHAPHEIVPRIRMLWSSIPVQLAKENRKFIYGVIKEGARAKDYELALLWLLDCGLIHKVNRISKPAMPLKAYEDFSAFKLFLVDVGLLATMGNIDVKTLLDGNAVFEEFKGALTEQYVLQQLLLNKELVTYYWSAEKSQGELDFLIQYEGKIVPIEVKAEENLQAKSLKSYRQKYNPTLSIRTSMSDYRDEEWLINVPLYGIGLLDKLIEENSI